MRAQQRLQRQDYAVLLVVLSSPQDSSTDPGSEGKRARLLKDVGNTGV